MTQAPALKKRDQKRMQRTFDELTQPFGWVTDDAAIDFLRRDTEAREYVRQVEYWSTWAVEDDEGVNARSRDHVKSARHHEDMQCKRAAEPVGYWLTRADGSSEWVEPDTSTEDNKRTRTTAAADARRKGKVAMTQSERKRLSRWRTDKAAPNKWVCPTHTDESKILDYDDCTLDCAEVYLSERQAATGRKSARHGL